LRICRNTNDHRDMLRNSNNSKSRIRQAVAVYRDATHLQEAIDALLAAGFSREEVSLLAGEHTVKQSLGDIYTFVNEGRDSPNAPVTAFVKKKSVGGAFHGVADGVLFAGSVAVLAIAVVLSAIFGGAVAAATVAVVGVLCVGGLMAFIIHQNAGEALHDQVERGHMLLFVRTTDAGREKQAKQILAAHGGRRVKVLAVSREDQLDQLESA
jgi:hypothetical protein